MAEQKRSFLKTWKKILPFMKPYRGKLIFGMIVMLLSSIVDTVLPLFSGYAVDNFVEPRSSDGIIPFAILYFLLITAVSIFTFLFARIALQIEMYMNRDIRKALFTHLQELDFTYYNSTPVGTILARVMSDTAASAGWFPGVWSTSFTAAVTLSFVDRHADHQLEAGAFGRFHCTVYCAGHILFSEKDPGGQPQRSKDQCRYYAPIQRGHFRRHDHQNAGH